MASRPFQLIYRSPDPNQPNQTLTITNPTQTITDLIKSLIHVIPDPTTSFFFTLNGKPLPFPSLSSPISSLNIPPLSTLTAHVRLLGGGGDGGSTCAESRDCYLNMYAEKKPDKVDPNEKRISKWTTCSLSYEPLTPPCVIDRLGNVFNKEFLVNALYHKQPLPKEFRHVRGLKDMINIHLSESPATAADGETKFECPISGLEFNGKYKFVAVRKCGHVLSAKAMKEVKSSGCLVCHEEFGEDDVIVINGSEEEVAALRAKLEEEEKVRAAVREKKRKAKREAAGEVNGAVEVKDEGEKEEVDEEEEERKKKKKKEGKKFKAVDVAPAHANSKVYASIFTSSRKSEFKETYSCRSLPLGRN